MARPNCYRCKYMEKLPDIVYIRCDHPANTAVLNSPLARMIATLSNVERYMAPILVKTKLSIEFNRHGFKMGWFNWPFLFDPIWLEGCSGFEEVKREDEVEI